MTEKVERMKQSADKRRAKPRYFGVGDRVLVRSVLGESVKWLPGKVTRVKSPTTYLVVIGNQVRFVHADHLRHSVLDDRTPRREICLPHASEVTSPPLPVVQPDPQVEQRPPDPGLTDNNNAIPLRRSNREKRPPERWCYDRF